MVLRNTLASFGARALLEGPDVILTVKAAQTFGLIAHELATNAAKYGALSASDGTLRVTSDIKGSRGRPQADIRLARVGGLLQAAQPKRFRRHHPVACPGAEFACLPQLSIRKRA